MGKLKQKNHVCACLAVCHGNCRSNCASGEMQYARGTMPNPNAPDAVTCTANTKCCIQASNCDSTLTSAGKQFCQHVRA